ncbi:MAG: SRPBCC family protein [Cyanobacteria bacterium P01_H01_bin.15]
MGLPIGLGSKDFHPALLFKSYRAISKAPVEILWRKLVDLADISWHPLFAGSNAPSGLSAKPGIIIRAAIRSLPIPVRLFVENVRPGEFLSLRILMLPGLEQRITYQVESTVLGTYIGYTISLRGWLTPIFWWLIKPAAAKVAGSLAQAAEQLFQATYERKLRNPLYDRG